MKKLARREEEIMEFLWENGPMFVKEIVALYDEPRPHFNTMSTVVRNLETLGYVGHNAYGSTYQVPLQGDRDAGELCGGASRVPSTVSTSNSSRGTSPETL